MRRKSREIALQFLFGHDSNECPSDPEALEKELLQFSDCFETGKKSYDYAQTLILAICSHQAEIDKVITSHSHNWRVERMSLVDRNILRIAVWEILNLEDVPKTVAINEALEIAKRYAEPDSVAFINGILDAVEE